MIIESWIKQAGISVPPRTRLFSLEPCGLGTAQVECLPSYLTRLGEAHCLSTARMIYEACPELRRSDTVATVSANWLNNEQFLVTKLSELTGRDDLDHLTMLAWRSLFAHTGLYRRYRARCLQCLAEQTIPYQPLIWCLEAVQICPIHKTPLSESCPFCSSKTRLRRTEITQDRCASCSRNICDAPSMQQTNYNPDEIDCWTAEQVSELIVCQPAPDEQLSSFNAVIEQLVMRKFRTCLGASEYFGFKPNFFYTAYAQSTTSLRRWAYFAWTMGFGLRQLLIEPPSTLQPKLRGPLSKEFADGRRRHTPTALQAKLETLLHTDTEGSLSHRQAAAILKVSPAILNKYCPAMSELLHQRYKTKQLAKRDARDAEWLDAIEKIVREAVDKGAWVSENAIKNQLGTKGMPYNFHELVELVRDKLADEKRNVPVHFCPISKRRRKKCI